MNLAAFIFARGGSKGLPNKNLLPLLGKPLIAWSIEQALSVDGIDNVFVSTDSLRIADIARSYGAEVPFIRPDELSKDESPEILAWRHGLTFLDESTGEIPEALVSIPATAPLRAIADIENCLLEYRKGRSDVVITVTDPHRNPYFNMVKIGSDGNCQLVNSMSRNIARRQDAPIVYDMATVCYVVNTNFLMTHDSLFEGRVSAVHVPIERALDIDTIIDFQVAEVLLSARKGII